MVSSGLKNQGNFLPGVGGRRKTVEQEDVLPWSRVFGVVVFDAIDGNKMIVETRMRDFPAGQAFNKKTAGEQWIKR